MKSSQKALISTLSAGVIGFGVLAVFLKNNDAQKDDPEKDDKSMSSSTYATIAAVCCLFFLLVVFANMFINSTNRSIKASDVKYYDPSRYMSGYS